jgi:hypothetical protein
MLHTLAILECYSRAVPFKVGNGLEPVLVCRKWYLYLDLGKEKTYGPKGPDIVFLEFSIVQFSLVLKGRLW